MRGCQDSSKPVLCLTPARTTLSAAGARAHWLAGVLSAEELAAEVTPHYDAFMRGDVLPEGKDLCDMSGAIGRERDEFTVYNAMLPRRYRPEMRGNLFERRCASIMAQLYAAKSMSIDYDQILGALPKPGLALLGGVGGVRAVD